MPRKKSDHIHKYKRINFSKSKEKGKEYWIYKCVKPGCTHYIPVELSEGLVCECNKCDNIMVITKAVLNGGYRRTPLAKPHCPDCLRTRQTPQIDAIAAFLEEKK